MNSPPKPRDPVALSASQLWRRLDPAVRALAAQALYEHDWGEAPARREADLIIARTMRFRDATVRQLPIGKRAEYLATRVRPEDPLASSLLLALHLEHRRPLLTDFLDALRIPHENGAIIDDHDLRPPAPESLAAAADKLFRDFPAEQVEVYLASLAALDFGTWGPLTAILAKRGHG